MTSPSFLLISFHFHLSQPVEAFDQFIVFAYVDRRQYKENDHSYGQQRSPIIRAAEKRVVFLKIAHLPHDQRYDTHRRQYAKSHELHLGCPVLEQEYSNQRQQCSNNGDCKYQQALGGFKLLYLLTGKCANI